MTSRIKICLVLLTASFCHSLFGQTTVTVVGNIKSSSSAVLNWQDGGGGTTSYTIKRSEVHGGPYATIQTGVTQTTFNDLGCQSGHTYYYVVDAVNSLGSSPDSNEAGPARIP